MLESEKLISQICAAWTSRLKNLQWFAIAALPPRPLLLQLVFVDSLSLHRIYLVFKPENSPSPPSHTHSAMSNLTL